MSNETKRDVLVDAVDALADAQASGGNIGHQDANLFMVEYEKALPDETEKQKNCPYCHEPHKLIESEIGNFLRIGMTGGNEWDRIEPKKINGAAIHTCEAVGFDNAEVDDPIVINYCPMCGRRLEGK